MQVGIYPCHLLPIQDCLGGAKGIRLATVRFRAGIAQGCPISTLIVCLLIKLRIGNGNGMQSRIFYSTQINLIQEE